MESLPSPPVLENKCYENLFWYSCRIGETGFLKTLILQNKFKVNQPLNESMLPLVGAVSKRNRFITILLLDHGADPNLPVGVPLKEAIGTSDLSLVYLLVKRGADVNPWGGLPLKEAIIKKNVSLVQILMVEGADPNPPRGCLALKYAIEAGNMKILECLLKNGANPNPPNCNLLMEAVVSKRPAVVRLLLQQGVDIRTDFVNTMIAAIDQAALGDPRTTFIFETMGILEQLFTHGCLLVDSPDETLAKFGKYSRLCRAVLRHNDVRVTEILSYGDYEDYASILSHRDRPACLALRFSGPYVIKVFLPFDLQHIYWEAVRGGDLEVLESCASNSKLDLNATEPWGYTPLHMACQNEQLEIFEVLVRQYGMNVEALDSRGRTPIFDVPTLEFLQKLLALFPDINVNWSLADGSVLLDEKISDCEGYTTLLEYGADPRLARQTDSHRCCKNKCRVTKHFQKLLLIGIEYVESFVHKVLSIDLEKFEDIQIPEEFKYEVEIEEMKTCRISQSIGNVPAENLYDFMFLKPNEAACYSKNKVLLEKYESHAQDFRNFLPEYGFVLNFQLRRGAARLKQLEAAGRMLCGALGTGMSLDLVEEILSYSSNSALKRLAK